MSGKFGFGFDTNTEETGTGTVTSFSSGNLSPLFTTSVANPTTTPALSFALVSQNQNLVYASPNGSSGNPAFRSLVTADMPYSFTSGMIPYATGTKTLGDSWLGISGNNVFLTQGKFITSQDVSKSQIDLSYGGADGNINISTDAGADLQGWFYADASTSQIGFGSGVTIQAVSGVASMNSPVVQINASSAGNEIQLNGDAIIFSGTTLRMAAYGFGIGKVLTSDGSGNATWQTPSGGTVTSVSGTADRITSTGGATPVIDIAATYVGQTSITTLGTIATGTWQGGVINSTYGGTGVNNAGRTITINTNNAAFTFSGAFTLTVPATGTATLGTGTNTQVAFFNGTNTVTSSASLTWDGTIFTANALNSNASGIYVGANAATANIPLYMTSSIDGNFSGIVRNTSAGTGAAAQYQMSNGTVTASFGMAGTGYTTYGSIVANTLYLYTNNTAGISLMVDGAGPIKFSTGTGSPAPERARFLTTGEFLVGGTAAILSTPEVISVQRNQDAATSIVISNTSTGTSAFSQIQVRNSATNVGFGISSTGVTGGGVFGTASLGWIGGGGANGMSIYAGNASGPLLFYTGGSAAANLRLTISSAGLWTFGDSNDFAFNTTTGTKIGTSTSQKFAFWNKTPIVQPTTGITGATLVSNAGTTITSTDTFGGYTLQQLAAIIINTGLAA